MWTKENRQRGEAGLYRECEKENIPGRGFPFASATRELRERVSTS